MKNQEFGRLTDRQKWIIGGAVVVVVLGVWMTFFRGDQKRVAIDTGTKPATETNGPANAGNVSPITGVACDNWSARPVAVMQPSDVSARPAAGFSQADMVFEMPIWTGGNTRLMGVYLCDLPDDIGSMRSGRHDYIPLAKSLDAVFVHWGYSEFAKVLLGQKVIDNIDCLTTDFCPRWPQTGIMKLEDTGHITKTNIEAAEKQYGYRTTGTFSGYPHQEEAALDQRPQGGHLRIMYPKPWDVSYDYDRATNTYLRSWDGVPDTDKNNKQRIAPKNIVVMMAESEQITLATDYAGRGTKSPWDLIPEADRAGINGVPGAPNIGRYNNLNIGDPWFDTKDSGDAMFYMDGQQLRGTWKKDKSQIDSKLTFYKDDGTELKFVPGQIYVEVVEPGEKVEWTGQ